MPVGRLTNAGWLDGILGCLKPMWMIIGKNKPNEVEKGEKKSIKKARRSYNYIFICSLQLAMGTLKVT